MKRANFPSSRESIDGLLARHDAGQKLIGDQREILRHYLATTQSSGGSLRPDTLVRIGRIRNALGLDTASTSAERVERPKGVLKNREALLAMRFDSLGQMRNFLISLGFNGDGFEIIDDPRITTGAPDKNYLHLKGTSWRLDEMAPSDDKSKPVQRRFNLFAISFILNKDLVSRPVIEARQRLLVSEF